MNNTKTLAIVAVLTAATLVLGGTLAATTTTTSAFAAKRDNGKRNDNTDADTIQKCKQFASGLDPTFGDQNCENLSNSTISQAAEIPKTCEECLTTFLTQGQINQLVMATNTGTPAGFCAAAAASTQNSEAQFRMLLTGFGVSQDNITQLIACLKDAGIPFNP